MKERVTWLTAFGNVSVALVTIITPIAVGVLLLKPVNETAESLKKRLERFHGLMYWTACLLVVGVIQVTYQSRWPSLLFDDETSIQSVGQMAAGAGLLVGCVFTIASGLIFLPTGYYLYKQDVTTAGSTSGTSNKTNNWLTEIIAILAPVLTALPIAKLFEIIR